MLGGLPVVLPLAWWQSRHIRWEGLSWGVGAGVFYVAVFATAAAMFLWNYAFTHLESGTAALTFFAQPVVGVLVGVLWLGDAVTWPFVVGGALIAWGMYLAALAPPFPVAGGRV
jgi:drug/metabolite transporter (DMT)-like permease